MRSRSVLIPSIFSDNPSVFKERLTFAETVVHAAQFDVLDGAFCRGDDNLAIEAWPKFNLEYSEVHLMVKNPLEYLERIAERKITRAIVHVESEFDLEELRAKARELDLLLGFSINPDTDLAKLRQYFEVSNYIQLMGVNPGHTGQKMLDTTVSAVSYLKRIPNQRLYIVVDGGVTIDNARALVDAGASFLVATTALFGSGDPKDNYDKILATLDDDDH